MNVGDTLYAISEAGLILAASKTEDTLKVYPVENITPGLAAAIKEHKEALIRVALKDQRFRQTGVIQSGRQISELARERFGPAIPFNPSEHPLTATPGGDPLVNTGGTDKAQFFRGNWREAWPRDFNVYKGGKT